MILRLAFGLVLVLATAALFHPRTRRLLSKPQAFEWLRFLFVMSRLAGWFLVYVALAELTQFTDLVLYYFPEASKAADGLLPYADFPTSYGPLFPYVSGALLWWWRSPAAVALVMVGIEVATVLLMASMLRAHREFPAASGTWLLAIYLLNPAAFYWSGIMGYNSSVIQLCWVLATRALLSGRYGVSIWWLGTSVAAGKFLGVLAAPIWLAHPGRRFRALGLAVGLAVAIWIVGRQYGIDLTLPLVREGDRSTAGNLWFLAGAVPGLAGTALWRYGPPLSLLIATAGVTAGLWRAWRDAPDLRQVCGALSAMGWLFLLVSKKSYPHYAPMFLVFTVAALCVGQRSSWFWSVLLASIGAIGIIEPGLWNALMQPQSLAQADLHEAPPLVIIDSILVVGGVSLAWGSIQRARKTTVVMV